MASENGIQIAGISSDGDPRLLKAMKITSKLGTIYNEDWPWYQSDINPELICIQDTVHIGTKLRTKFIKPTSSLKIGNFLISVAHIRHVIENISKDNHLLTASDINAEDKMNFKSVTKICDPKVVELLAESVPESEGTVFFLNLIRDVLDSFLKKDLVIQDRIYKIWYSVFLLRIWRQWVLNSNLHTLAEHFITLNAYVCIELNAHSIITMAKKCSESTAYQPQMFLPWLMSSQPCEEMFRATRSMTTTFSTIVNYSMQEILNRINKIQFLQEAKNELQPHFNFGVRNKGWDNALHNTDTNTIFISISDAEIKETVEKAQTDAIKCALQLGIDESEEVVFESTVMVHISTAHMENETDHNCDAEMSEESTKNNFDCNSGSVLNSDIFEDSDPSDEEVEVDHSNTHDGPLCLKDYTSLKGDEDPLSQEFLKIKLPDGSSKIVKKSSLCWLFTNNTTKLSSDRLHKFKTKNVCNEKVKNSENTAIQSENVCENVLLENYYAVYYDSKWYIGRVLNNISDNTVEIKFLKEVLETFSWPRKEDRQVVEKMHLFYGPIQMEGCQPLKLKRFDRDKINALYKSIKRNLKL